MSPRQPRRDARPDANVGQKPRAAPEPDFLAVEAARPRGRLRSITLRLGVEQIAEARQQSTLTGVPYQVVLRQWIAHGAAIAQRRRSRKKR